jgi:predicted ATPase
MSLIETISDISQGNPSLIWKIINHLKEEGSIDIDMMTLSMSDNGLILSLLKAYTHLQLVILKTASVIGEEFSVRILKLIVPVAIEPSIDASLDLFVDNGFLFNLGDGFYGFSSSLLRKMIYDLIPERFVDPHPIFLFLTLTVCASVVMLS